MPRAAHLAIYPFTAAHSVGASILQSLGRSTQQQPRGGLKPCMLQVVDEADRLLRQFYHGWLAALRAVLGPAAGAAGAPRRVVQILVSATLTHDPAKLAQFQLHSPR